MNIWVNGCFDILHTGHIDLLWYAKNFITNFESYLDPRNKLFVGLDSDERVKQLKGDKRPINDIETRVKIMSNLRMIDEVVIFNNNEELRNFIKFFNIDFMIVGDQYNNKEVIGSEFSKYGVIYYPVDNRSTTDIIKKMKVETTNEIYTEIYEQFKDDNTTIGMNFNNFAVGKLNKLKI